MSQRRRVQQPREAQHSTTLLDVYQNFTRGIFRQLKINPKYICGFDELTSLFSLITSVAMILISFSYIKPNKSQIESFIYTGYNTEVFGCNYTKIDNLHFFGNTSNVKIAIVESNKQASFSSLLSAAGKLSCQGYGIIVGNLHDIQQYKIHNVRIVIPGDGAEIIIGGKSQSILNNDGLYVTYSAKGKDLQLRSFFSVDEYENIINNNAQKMFSELSRIVNDKSERYQFFGIFIQFKIPTPLFFILIPLFFISIALNLNIIHRYLRKIIIKDFFFQSRIFVGLTTYILFFTINKLLSLINFNYEFFANTQDNLFKAIVCFQIFFSILFGKYERSEFYPQNQAISSVLAYVLSVFFYRQFASYFLKVALISIFSMYVYDVLIMKKITARPWTKNASYILLQMPYVIAITMKQLAIIQQTNQFHEYYLIAIILLTIAIGYIPGILRLSTGPIFLLSTVFIAACIFLQGSFTNAPLQNLRDNLLNIPKTSQVPLIFDEIKVDFYCQKQLNKCIANSSNSNIEFNLEDGNEIKLFKGKVILSLPESESKNIDFQGLKCGEVKPDVKVQDIVFRQIGRFFDCE